MAAIDSAITAALATADKLKQSGGAGNEANTKALLIEPILAALGWDTADFTEVDREFKVYDGTFLDYALRISGQPRLFVEAKALGKKLDDKPFIAQTVNYANNEGVVWCVLTNGLLYRIYKSNEPVSMEKKLLLEIDLRSATDSDRNGAVMRSLAVLSRDSILAGHLDALGESVFTDVRTRAALTKLSTEPTKQFLTAVSAAIEGPHIETRRLQASLRRILAGGAAGASEGALLGSPPDDNIGESTPDGGKTAKTAGSTTSKKAWTLDHHLAKKPAAIVNLYEQTHDLTKALGEDVSVRITKMYVGYFAGKKSFVTFEPQKGKILVYLSLPASTARPWIDGVMRDVSKIGHYGMGDTEFVLTGSEQLDDLRTLLSQAYRLNRS